MSRFFFTVACLMALGSVASAQGQWVTIKGQITFSKPPAAVELNVTTDKEHCLSKGPIKSNLYEVNPANKGFKNVAVFLRPDDAMNRNAKFKPNEIHPDLANPKPKEIVIDQPCCMFEPRVIVARAGDTLVVKNSAPVNHNYKWTSNNNGEGNANIPPGQSFKFAKPLAEERAIVFECNVHPWMKGMLRVYDHPYYALTDKDGKFEIKNAPAGKFRIVYFHEEGLHNGADGRWGTPIEIKGDAKGTMEMKPVEFDFKRKL